MNEPVDPPAAGLCASCCQQQLVPTTRGSSFSLCRRSREDERYPRYPRLPVVRCQGYERRGEGGPTSGLADADGTEALRVER